jgi:aminoglycoside phosphotransferase (APT) family kinase protein
MSDWAALAASATPLTGGYGGETYAVSAGGEDAVLRLYVKAPDRARVDLALMRLVRGLLPVPRVLDAMTEPEDGAPAFVLYERLPGVSLETFLATADEGQRRRVGVQLGELLARLSGMPFLRYGEFAGADLTVQPFDLGELPDWYRRQSIDLGPERESRLLAVLDEAEDVLAEGTDRYCLCHSDFNPKNLLVDPDTATVTGLVDWEFAHSGSPYTDLGNLLRFDADQALGSAAIEVVRRTAPGGDDPELLNRVRAADLWAVIELAGRAGQNPVADAALDLLRRTADTGDLAAGRPSY